MVNTIQFIEQCLAGVERNPVELNEEQRVEKELAAITAAFAV